MNARQILGSNIPTFTGDMERLIHLAEKALDASKITSYAQGFALLRSASKKYEFGYNNPTLREFRAHTCHSVGYRKGVSHAEEVMKLATRSDFIILNSTLKLNSGL